MDIAFLVKITSRAWALSILASLDRGVPGRQAPLLAAIGAGRTAFAQSMAHLIELGLVERNPGHGHPLRPEFRLTLKGLKAARMAGQILAADLPATEPGLLRRVWTVPVLAVCQSPRHFGAIKADLAPITDRALSQTLKQLHLRNWVRRRTDGAEHPPRPLYQAANAGLVIGQAATTLAL
ncbi:MAG: winged helix-turn-helix transcriptional regulator [Pseudomonadota bacterium]